MSPKTMRGVLSATLPQAAGPSRLAIEALRAHPHFDRAMRLAADGIVGHFDGKPLLSRLMNDRGRALFAIGALYLDADPDPSGSRLTSARLIEFAQLGGYASAGRAKAMIALLQWRGYLQSGSLPADRRQRPLVPTEKLWGVVVDRWRSQLKALALLRPVGAEALRALDNRRFSTALIVAMGRMFCAGFRVLDQLPRLAPLAERDAALVVLLVMMGATRDGIAPPPIAHLARRFGVSRAHARSVLREAEFSGLLAADGETEALRSTPALEEEIAQFFATTLAVFEHASERALASGYRIKDRDDADVAFHGDARAAVG